MIRCLGKRLLPPLWILPVVNIAIKSPLKPIIYHRHPKIIRLDYNTFQILLRREKTLTVADQLKKTIDVFVDSCTVVLRFIQLQLLFAPVIISYPIYYFLFPHRLGDWHWLVLTTLSYAGATFIKLGQWASTRPDVLSPELCSLLGKLHNKAAIHPFEFTRESIKRSFGRNIEDIFSEFDQVPVGSGCIGQVYKAKIRTLSENAPEKVVAVKVSHPGITRAIQTDLKILRFVANVINVIPTMKWINIPEEVHQFSDIMKRQLDLRYEARNLYHFKWNFEKDLTVTFPIPLFPLVSRDVMVETFEEGIPISNFILPQNIKSCTRDLLQSFNSKLVSIGFNSFLKMLLVDNFVHADLHPGNIQVQFIERQKFSFFHRQKKSQCNFDFTRIKDDTTGKIDYEKLNDVLMNETFDVRILYLDAGLVSSLSKEHFRNFLDLFKALVLYQDGYAVGKLIIERSKHIIHTPTGIVNIYVQEPETFCKSMEKVVTNVFSKRGSIVPSFKLSDLQISAIMFDVFRLVRKHHVKLDEAYTNLVMSLICVEGLGRQLLPSADLLPYLRNIGIKYIIKKTSEAIPSVVQ